VVLGPTRELASQIGNEILELKHNEKDFNVLTVYGGINVYNNLKELGKKIDVLVGTPGRVKDLIERGALNF
jgi:ATP-dependent RNA helicase DeaD